MGSSENAKFPDESHGNPAGEISQRNAEVPRTISRSISDWCANVEGSTHMILAESFSPIALRWLVRRFARSPENDPGR